MTTPFFRRAAAPAGAALALALVLAGCGASIGGDDGDDADAGPSQSAPPATGGTVTVAVGDGWTAYNPNTTTGGASHNIVVRNLIQSSFWTTDETGAIVRNEQFGSFEKVSDDPLTVEYTLHEDAVWSDGTPIDFDDALLDWAADSMSFTDDAGQPLFDVFGSATGPLKQQPEGEPGDKSFTIVYSEPTADWETAVTSFLPAHVVAREAGMSPEELVEAIRTRDAEAVARIAEFWNTGWQYTAEAPVPDPELVPASGPFRLASRDGSSLVLERNEEYWGTPAELDTLVLRTLDPAEQVPALVNGDVDVIRPQADGDVLGQLEGAGGVTTLTGDQITYDHVDFRLASPVFASLEARQAFAACVPRQQIVDNLYATVNPDAQIAQLREYLPFQPEYETVLAGVPTAAEYAETDLDAARGLLAASGVADPSITLLTSATNARHSSIAAMIESSCEQAGFDVTLDLDANWSEKMGTESWDAVLFQWSGTGTVAATQDIFVTGGGLNFGGYSDAEVDAIWAEIVATTDPATVPELKARLEERLWATMYNVPIATQPAVTAFSDRVAGVVHNPTGSGVTFNAAEWSVTG